MKSKFVAVGVVLIFWLFCARIASAGPFVVGNLPLNGGYVCVKRGPNSKIWQRIVVDTNPFGLVRTNVHSYTELGTGLCYLKNGQYVDSVEQIDSVAGGAQAVQGRHRVFWAANANTSGGAVQLTTPDNKILKSSVYGLAYYNTATGSNVLLARLQDSTATITTSNTLVYMNAFSNLAADIRYTYRKNGLSQDIVFRQRPPAPSEYGMDPTTTRLEVLTEFFEAPVPKIQSVNVNALPDDRRLNFGEMKMGVGRAFFIQSDAQQGPRTSVIKQWTNLDNRTFLLEEVPYLSISNRLGTLHSSTIKPDRHGVRRTVYVDPSNTRRLSINQSETRAKVMKTAARETGLVLDYDIVSSTNSFTFQGDTTYYISGEVDVDAALNFEGGTVIKYSDTGGSISTAAGDGPITFDTSLYRPAVFTSADDNTVGDIVAGSTGTPTTNGSIYLSFGQSSLVKGARFSYASIAVQGGGDENDFRDCQFLHCEVIAAVSGPVSVSFKNVLAAYAGCLTIGSDSVSMDCENMTLDALDNFYVHIPGSGLFHAWVTNSILSAVSSGTSSVTFDHSSVYTNDAGLYQTLGAASYYLAEGSTNRGLGTINVDTNLLADLEAKTTYPPTNIIGGLSGSNVFSEYAIRDSSGTALDLGYHYDPIDYVLNVDITNATVTIEPGTVIGTFGGGGIYADTGVTLATAGTATQPCYIVNYNTVQEQSTTNWATSYPLSFLMPMEHDPSVNVAFRFTTWATLTQGGQIGGSMDQGNNPNDQPPTRLQDCQIYNGTIGSTAQTITSSNCLFRRVSIDLEDGGHNPSLTVSNTWANNLFVAGALAYYHDSADLGVWTFRDNLFDQTSLSANSNSVDVFSNNAFVTTNYGTLPLKNQWTILSNSPSYETGSLGDYYYPANATNLIHQGSETAAAAGLYHYTVSTNNSIEGTNVVSIGFHYVATEMNGVPLTSNTNGVPDYLADANGNGVVDSGEVPWANMPAITGQPVSQVVGPGSNVTFTVTATGTSPLLYQWIFDGTNIVGATTSGYAITNVQVSDSGSYTAIVTNVVGSVTSVAAELTCEMIARPVLNPPPGAYALVQEIEVSCSTPGAIIHYTTDGTAPLITSPVLPANRLVLVQNSSLLQAAAFTNGVESPIVSGDYYIVGAIAAGYDHSLYLNPYGSVFSWGENWSGQLGIGTSDVGTSIPNKIIGLSNITQIAASDELSLALDPTNAYEWGYDGGEAGTGTTNNGMELTPVTNLMTNAAQVALGDSHILAVDANGNVWSWGYNWSGQLGDGSIGDVDPTPTVVSGIGGVSAIGAGYDHSLAISNGLVYGWGDNNSGQLGDYTGEAAISVVQITAITNAISVQGSYLDSYVLCSDGTVWACGYNGDGELGVGTNDFETGFVQVHDLTNVVSISASPDGLYCLALTSDGMVWAWGSNADWFYGSCGQLGNGSCDSTNLPTKVLNLTNIVSISAGGAFAMALQDNGTIWAWGDNLYGELGNFSGTSTNVPVEIMSPHYYGEQVAVLTIVGGDGQIADAYTTLSDPLVIRVKDTNGVPLTNALVTFTVNLGDIQIFDPESGDLANSVAVVTDTNGEASVWASLGTNEINGITASIENGTNLELVQFYEGITLPTPTLTPIAGTFKQTETVTVSCSDTNLTMYYTEDGTPPTPSSQTVASGATVTFSNSTQLIVSTVPVGSVNSSTAVGSYFKTFDAIACGQSHIISLIKDGTVVGWGDNSDGQIGPYAGASSDRPLSIPGLSNIIAVAAGSFHSVALDSNGFVWTLGDNSVGQLGENANIQSNLPVQVPGVSNVVAISAGFSNTFAILTDGTVQAWGINQAGQLGIGNQSLQTLVVQVNGITNAKAIAVGYSHVLALLSNGIVMAWGSNGDGDLGSGNTLNSFIPIQVPGLSNIVAVGAGWGNSFALKSDGTLWAWGLSQLGTGNQNGSESPVLVTNFGGAALSINGYYDPYGSGILVGSLALTTNNEVFTWGANFTSGDPPYYLSPTLFANAGNPVTIAAGGTFGAALMPDLSVEVWARNGQPILGTSGEGGGSFGPFDIIDDWNTNNPGGEGDYYNGTLPQLAIQSGDGQVGYPNSYFAQALVVQVIDAHGNPLTNAPITFSGGNSGVLLSFVTNSGAWPKLLVNTDSNGMATAWAYQAIVNQLQNVVTATAQTGTNSSSVTFHLLTRYPQYMAYWRFADTNWAGEEGQTPESSNNVVPAPSFGEFAALFAATNANLSYNTVETNGQVNFTPSWGTIELWYRPTWSSSSMGGSGPGSLATMLEAGRSLSPVSSNWWRIAISADGNNLMLDTSVANVFNNSFTAGIQLMSNQWHQITVTYDQNNSAFYLDGQFVTNGFGVGNDYGLDTFSNFYFGNGSGFGTPASGQLEEIKTYNLALDATTISNDYAQSALYPTIANSLKSWLIPESLGSATNSSEVSYWPDSSGNGNGAFQTNVNEMPTYFTNMVNGLSAVEFAGSNEMNLGSFASGWTQGEIFIVHRVSEAAMTPSYGNGSGFWTFGGSGLETYYPFNDGTNVIVDDFGSGSSHTLIPVYPIDQFEIYSAASDSNSWSASFEGIPIFFSDTNSVAFPTNLVLGASHYGMSNNVAYFGGDIAEVLLFNETLSMQQENAIQAYLQRKYLSAPSVPGPLNAIPLSSTQIRLYWPPNSQPQGVTYIVERSSPTNDFEQIAALFNTNLYIDAALNASEAYTYRIEATNYAGASGYSTPVTATTFSVGTEIPVAQIDLWFDATTLGVVAGLTNNAPVFDWIDASGQGRDAILNSGQADASVPVLVINAINGLPAVSFSGGRYFGLPGFQGTNNSAEMFAVVKADSDTPASPQNAWELGGSASYWNWGTGSLVASTYYPDVDESVAEDFASTTAHYLGPQPVAQFHIVNFTGADGDWEANMDGINLYSTDQNSFGFSTHRTLGGGINPFDGDIAELITFNRQLTSDERQAVEDYMGSKYGIAGNQINFTGLKANALSSSQIMLTWRTDAATNLEVTYNIERKQGPSGISELVASVINATNYTDGALAPGTEYDYQIQAIADNGNTGISTNISAETLTNPPNCPPWITLEPANQNLGLGSNAIFSVTAAGADPLSYQWQFNGVPISDATLSTLSILGVQLTNAGDYNVIVSNASGTVTSVDASLIVEIAPTITNQPESSTNDAGTTVAFTVQSSGSQPLSYQWAFNGGDINGATNSAYCLTNVQSTNAGSFSVFVTNLAGTVSSSNAVLTVNALDTNGLPDYWELQFFGTTGVDPLADPDYDGRNNYQEFLDGTDPTNAASAKSVLLGYWHFTDTNWIGQEGQIPLVATNLELVSSFSGGGVLVNNNSNSCLTYRDVETNGRANINCRDGSVVFWVRPAWNGGVGPGNVGRLIEMGDTNSPDGWWSLWVDPTGSTMTFQSRSNNILVTYFTNSISGWASNTFYQVALTYSPNQTALYIDGALAATGTGISNYPDINNRSAYGFTLGADHAGQLQFHGAFAELQTFNAPLSATSIQSSYNAISGPSGNGMAAYLHWLEGWSEFASGVVADTNGSINLVTYTSLH